MKQFSIVKVGYTAGVYGCSGEYFMLILPKVVYYFSGLYGTEERISAQLKEVGYKERYIQGVYGQLKKGDIPKTLFYGEYQMLEVLKTKKHLTKYPKE